MGDARQTIDNIVLLDDSQDVVVPLVQVANNTPQIARDTTDDAMFILVIL